MIRSILARRLLVGALLFGLSASPALAAGQAVTIYDQRDNALGTAANPLVTTGGGGGAGGSGNAATTSNGTDGQATSSTNQQNVVFPYLFNGSTWDRARGTGGALNVFSTNGAVETGGNLATLVARTPVLGQAPKASSQPVTLASDQGPLTVSPNACTIAQTVVTLSANTSAQLVAANPARKSLSWMDVGTNPFTAAPGTAAAVVGQGINYSGASAAGQQGGSEAFSGSAVATGAFQAISASGTTVVVWDCQ